MRKLKLGVLGGGGRMGQAISDQLKQEENNKVFQPFLSVSTRSNPVFSLQSESLKNIESDVLSDIDVWIDFSSPDGSLELIGVTSKLKTPIVCGTTGFAEKQFEKVTAAGRGRPYFWASNMSPGLWAFRQAMKGLESLHRFDFAIEEIHHTKKKDKPSGTAKTIHKDLERIVGKKIEEPTALRLGGVFGIHTIYAASENEVITMQHQALNRGVFAQGSLIAAAWLVKQKAGYYSVDDVFSKK